MRKQNVVFSFILLVIVFTITLTSCKKDDPTALTLSTIVIGTIDLNGATAPSNVPVSPSIVATFSTDVDATTAISTNILLQQDYDKTDIPVTIQVSGKVVTITPTSALGNGSLYKLTFLALKATNGEKVGAFERAFTTEGTFAPTGQIAYWNFDDNANDQIGSYDPAPADIIDVTYSASRNAVAGKAATFNGTTTIIEVPNGNTLMNATNFSICFWVKTNSAAKTGGHFVMGLAGWYGFQYEMYGGYDGAKFAFRYALADNSTASEDMWFPALADQGWQGWSFAKSLTADQMKTLLKDTWLHVTYTYNGATKVGTLYYNGEKMKSFDFNLWPAGDVKKGVTGQKYDGNALGNRLAFGFIQGRNNRTISDTWADYSHADANGHFKGQLDDVRIFHKAITAGEVGLIYNSEKP
jgi:hypothetical protein